MQFLGLGSKTIDNFGFLKGPFYETGCYVVGPLYIDLRGNQKRALFDDDVLSILHVVYIECGIYLNRLCHLFRSKSLSLYVFKYLIQHIFGLFMPGYGSFGLFYTY